MIQNSGIRIAPYLVGVVLFILPFIQVSCSGDKVLQLTGVQLVTGSEMQEPMSEKTKKIPPEPLSVAAIIALGIGAAFCISRGRVQSILAAIAGGVALVAMIVLKTRMDAEITKQTAGMPITVEYLAGFWGVCIAALAGLILSIMRVNEKRKDIG